MTAVLPKIEVLIIVVFFLSFMIWAISKCSATKEEYRAEETQEEPVAAEPVAAPVDTVAPEPEPQPIRERYTPLYITIDGTNIRAEPTINSAILDRLNLFDEVVFLNEVSDFTEEISLGKTIANEPWIRVRTKKGKVGWVYGACVHYYKYKHPGAE